MRRYAIALVGNSAAADDLVQDCIEKALRQSTQLRDGLRLAPWLRSILHNLYIDDIRQRRRRGVEEDIANLADDFSVSVPAQDRSAFNEFVAAMGTMSVEHRQILLLVGLEGMNYREIAEELRVPIGTVMSRLARARERLRGALVSGAKPVNAEVTYLAQRKAER